MNINDKAGIRATFAARPDLKEVHVLEDGRHFFRKAHADTANGLDEDGKPNEVKYKTLKADAKELKDEAPTT